jgi:hypothetical protein
LRAEGHRMPFWKLGVAALAISAGTGCAGTLDYGMLVNKYEASTDLRYGARDAYRLQVGKRSIDVMFPLSSIAELDAASTKLRKPVPESHPRQTGEAIVWDEVVYNSETTRFIPNANGIRVESSQFHIVNDTGQLAIGYTIYESGGAMVHRALIITPPKADKHPQGGSDPGTHAIVADEFRDLFRQLTGTELKAVKVLQSGDFEGRYTVHVIGVDEAGKPIGQYKGGILCFGINYVPLEDKVSSGIGLLVEPGTPDPVTGRKVDYR